MQRGLLIVAAATGFTAVAAGAFGAHAVKDLDWVTPTRLAVWETGADYHLAHAVVLLVCAALPLYQARLQRLACAAFFGGVVIFSGSLYLLVLTDTAWLGAITPIGGLLLLAGWALLAATGVAALRKGTRPPQPQPH